MKRLLLMISVVGALFATAFAAAEGLNVTSGALQNGEQADLSCTASASVAWNDDDDNGDIESATVSGINGACAGGDVQVGVYGNDDCETDMIAFDAGSISGNSGTVTFSPNLTLGQVADAECVLVQVLNGNAQAP